MSQLCVRRGFRGALALACAFLGMLAMPASATSTFELSIAERTQRSDRVVWAMVVGAREEGDAARELRTVTTLQVRENWKGEGSSVIELVQLGGREGGFRTRVIGDAELRPGEQVIAFLRCGRAGVSASASQSVERCTLFGLAAGKLSVEHADGVEEVVEKSAGGRVSRTPLAQVRDEVARAARTAAAPAAPVTSVAPKRAAHPETSSPVPGVKR